MPKKLPRRWRGDFLRALARGGNVRLAARSAGVHAGTAYDHRIKDDGFAAKWEEALAKARERPPDRRRRSRACGKAGEELIVRHSKRHGTQLVRAAPGRWCARAEAAFLAELRRTGNARAAARASGLSRTALYNRRARDAGFAQLWAAAEAAAGERIPVLLRAATIASLDPEVEEDGQSPVDVDQAIAICRLKGWGGGAGAGADRPGRGVPEAPPIEEVRAGILARLDAIEAHEKRNAPERE